jgi:hypothetical protein
MCCRAGGRHVKTEKRRSPVILLNKKETAQFKEHRFFALK